MLLTRRSQIQARSTGKQYCSDTSAVQLDFSFIFLSPLSTFFFYPAEMFFTSPCALSSELHAHVMTLRWRPGNVVEGKWCFETETQGRKLREDP